jgi:hypothetical protein
VIHYPHSPGHRHTDTSAGAAASVAPDADNLRGLCLGTLRQAGPLTADEVADRLGLSVLTVRPRMTELRRMGHTTDTGKRRPNLSGRPAIVWEANQEDAMTPNTCTACGAPVIWARTTRGKNIPVDAEPSDRGNVFLAKDKTGKPEALFMPRNAGAIGERLHTCHLDTCPGRPQLSDGTGRFVETMGSSRQNEQQSAKDSPGPTDGPPDNAPPGFLFPVAEDASRR